MPKNLQAFLLKKFAFSKQFSFVFALKKPLCRKLLKT